MLVDPPRASRLAWIHRAEARALAAELRAAGREIAVARFDESAVPAASPILLRLSDPLMVHAARVLTDAGIAYRGPGAGALARCYDKRLACETVAADGIDIPDTRLAIEGDALARPIVLKPRRGSDSIGVRILRTGAVPARLRDEHTLAQSRVIGAELTIGVIDGIAGRPLRFELPEGVPYTFLRKYVLRPSRAPVGDDELARRVRETALRIAAALGVDWAARIDLILERGTRRLVFLECDAAPLVGAASTWAASLAAGGMDRGTQLTRLLGEA